MGKGGRNDDLRRVLVTLTPDEFRRLAILSAIEEKSVADKATELVQGFLKGKEVQVKVVEPTPGA